MSHPRIIMLALVASLGLWTACSGGDTPATGTDSHVATSTDTESASDSGATPDTAPHSFGCDGQAHYWA